MAEHAPKTDKPILDYDQLFPGRFLKAGLFRAKPVTLTIEAVYMESLPKDKGGTQDRGIIRFALPKDPRELVLNKTNGEVLKSMFGPSVPGWIGKRVTFFCGRDRFGTDDVDAIRIQGSPDLKAPKRVTVTYKRRASQTFNLTVTTPAGGPAPTPTSPTPERTVADRWAAIVASKPNRDQDAIEATAVDAVERAGGPTDSAKWTDAQWSAAEGAVAAMADRPAREPGEDDGFQGVGR